MDHMRAYDSNGTFFLDEYGYTLWLKCPLCTIYIALLLTGIFGNICTCIVIIRNKTMHTTTNYYLFSLAISDFLLILFSPIHGILYVWQLYDTLFAIQGPLLYVINLTMCSSILTVTLFTVERYLAICQPFYSLKLSQKKRVVKCIIAVWFLSLVIAFVQTTVDYGFDLLVIYYVIPFCLILVLCTLIIAKVRKSRQNSNKMSNNSYQGSSNSNDNSVIQILVAIIIVFFTCWTPYHVFQTLQLFTERSTFFYHYLVGNISVIFYSVSAVINPLLYSVMSKKFRDAFKETFLRNSSHNEAVTTNDLEVTL